MYYPTTNTVVETTNQTVHYYKAERKRKHIVVTKGTEHTFDNPIKENQQTIPLLDFKWKQERGTSTVIVESKNDVQSHTTWNERIANTSRHLLQYKE